VALDKLLLCEFLQQPTYGIADCLGARPVATLVNKLIKSGDFASRHPSVYNINHNLTIQRRPRDVHVAD
jgi:hypothetical protein